MTTLHKPNSGDAGYSGASKASVVVGAIVDALENLTFDVKAQGGAAGDGSTDDTTAIQGMINAAAALNTTGSTGGAKVFFPPGRYVITSKLQVPRGVALEGHLTTSQIYCTASATPIIEAQGTQCHSVKIHNLGLAYSASQSDPASIGIAFPSSGGNTGPYYWWSIQGVVITNAYIGIGLGSTSAVWFSSQIGTASPVVIQESFQSAISHKPATGSPGNAYGTIYISNSVVTPASIAVRWTAGENLCNYLSVSGWTGQILESNSGNDINQINLLHVETCTVVSAGSQLFDITGGYTRFGQLSVSLTYTAASSGAHYIFRAPNANAQTEIEQLLLVLTNSGSGTIRLFNSSNAGTTRINIHQLRQTGAAVDTGGGTATLYQAVTNYLGSQARRVFALTDAATVTVNPLFGDYFTLAAAAGRTIGAPAYPWSGQVLTFDVLNSSGGAMVTTWNATYKLAGAWVDPANTKRRKIQFTYDGTNYIEDFRTAADI